MRHKTFLSTDNKSAILLRSHDFRQSLSNAPRTAPRKQAEFNSKSYRDSLQRAFNTVKKQVFFNPDMNQFITLTYAGKNQTSDDVLYDIKQFIKKERRQTTKQIKYIYILEYQKRGSIHVHMIANDALKKNINKNGYYELTNWNKGFSSVLSINNTDKNFKPYLYLFKYMTKTEKIGKSFVHSSKNLKNYAEVDADSLDFSKYNTVYQEVTESKFLDVKKTYYYSYLNIAQ